MSTRQLRVLLFSALTRRQCCSSSLALGLTSLHFYFANRQDVIGRCHGSITTRDGLGNIRVDTVYAVEGIVYGQCCHQDKLYANLCVSFQCRWDDESPISYSFVV